MQPQNNTNSFFGIRVSNPGINVANALPNQLMYENNYQTETFYSSGGTTLQIGNLGNNSYGMTVPATNGTINFGLLSDGSLGMQVVDNSGFILFEMNGTTWFWYDKTTNKNVMQVGLLPDGTYGMAVAKSGYNVSDGI
jgi:hypothetical protein